MESNTLYRLRNVGPSASNGIERLHHSKANIQTYLERLSKRSVLSRQEQEALFNLPGYVVQLPANRDFTRPGQTLDHVSLIVAGIAGQGHQGGDGTRQIAAIHVPGDMANLQSVVQPQAAPTLRALTDTIAVRIPHEALRAAIVRYPALGEALWRDCMLDAAILSKWIANMRRLSPMARIAHLICEMAIRLGADLRNDAVRFPFALEHSHLGEATGLTPVHVKAIIQSLRKERLLDFLNQDVAIHDWRRLVVMADFDADYLQCDIKPEHRLRIIPTI